MGALLIFLVALLALGGAVQRAAAVPFSSLSPPPALRVVTVVAAGNIWGFPSLCVLSASGCGISSIGAADLAQYHSSVSRCSDGSVLSAVDLR